MLHGHTVPSGTTKHESISSINRTAPNLSSAQQHHQQHPTPQQVVERSKQTCACSCVGWAEIYIRRPTGNMSWIMRNQNQISFDTASPEFPLNDLVNLFVPKLGGVFNSDFHSENPSPTSACSPDPIEHTRKISGSSQQSDTRSQDDDYSGKQRIDNDDSMMVTQQQSINRQTTIISSGPIAIPKPSQPAKESAGSFSDVEPEVEEENPYIEYEDDESRSRNPVRRVNSSPEMSTNWRNPLLNAKGVGVGGGGGSSNSNSIGGAVNASLTISSSSVLVITSGSSGGPEQDDKTIPTEMEQQQKKKGFCKDMRVSCEAIPEEIPGSTPPSHPNSVKEATVLLDRKTTLGGGIISEQIEVTAKQAQLVPSASFPTETKSESETLSPQGQIVPKKQLSADDVVPSKNGIEQHLQSQPIQQQQPPLQLQLQQSTSKLKLAVEMPKVTTKPPQSPAPLSPRLLAKNAANKISSFAPSAGGGGNGNTSTGIGGNGSGVGGMSCGSSINTGNGNSSNGDLIRGRSKTISVVSDRDSRDGLKWTTFKGTRSGLSPSSIFLQLYNAGANKSLEQPIQIGPNNAKAIPLLDLIPPYETHKIGVLYVGQGQNNKETEILRNRHGSFRYTQFLRRLGTLVALKDAKENNFFMNMDANGRDGVYTYVWQDEIIQVTFHVATLMPNKDQDPNCHEKKKHIGNDFVSIIYNESGEEYNLATIKVCILVFMIDKTKK